ncbi:hypothetical protein [Deinococcus hopiensis]|uniref:hypothetical protein n=1 Tax=Deinococcus hopiensis TaxID=309885 RepID=UPI00111C8F4E|nr:hypothetical protein [Deinococcus hopiensis]
MKKPNPFRLEGGPAAVEVWSAPHVDIDEESWSGIWPIKKSAGRLVCLHGAILFHAVNFKDLPMRPDAYGTHPKADAVQSQWKVYALDDRAIRQGYLSIKLIQKPGESIKGLLQEGSRQC